VARLLRPLPAGRLAPAFPDAALDAEAAAVAAIFGLPLTVIDVGTGGLEHELELLLAQAEVPR